MAHPGEACYHASLSVKPTSIYFCLPSCKVDCQVKVKTLIVHLENRKPSYTSLFEFLGNGFSFGSPGYSWQCLMVSLEKQRLQIFIVSLACKSWLSPLIFFDGKKSLVEKKTNWSVAGGLYSGRCVAWLFQFLHQLYPVEFFPAGRAPVAIGG